MGEAMFKLSEKQAIKEWLEVRKQAGLQIDPATAEVMWTYGFTQPRDERPPPHAVLAISRPPLTMSAYRRAKGGGMGAGGGAALLASLVRHLIDV
jgi:hypothetical protein